MTVEPRRASPGLGRGLAALIPPRSSEQSRTIPLRSIHRNPHQPRRRIDPDDLERLAASIGEHGVLQPVLVSETDDGYQLIAGERRVQAAGLAGLDQIPAFVRPAAEREQLVFALVENIQRADLNAMDEAHAYRELIADFGLTQEEVARRVGRSRSTVTNTLRLLETAPDVQAAVSEGRISEGHARAIGSLTHHGQQEQLLAVVIERELSVRQTESLARNLREPVSRVRPESAATPDPELERVEASLRTSLGTKVTVRATGRGGRITIEYYDADDLGRLYERLAGGAP